MTRQEVEALYARFAPVVFRRAKLLLGRDADAWDAVQEVFEKMLADGSGFRGEARPMTWVYRVTTNVCLNVLRGRKLREPAGSEAPEPATTQDARSVETRQLLDKWMGKLDERELTVATLLFIDELTQEEIADTLGLSRKTIGRELDAIREKARALS